MAYKNANKYQPANPGTVVGELTTTPGHTMRGGGTELIKWKWNGAQWETITGNEYNRLLKKGLNPTTEQLDAEDELDYVTMPYVPTVADKGIGSLRFPSDVATSSDSEFVIFDFYDYKPPFQGKTSFYDQNVTANGKKVTALNQTLELYNATGYAAEYFKSKVYPQVLLYMPPDISDTFKADWEGKAFGSNTAGILASAGAESVTEKLAESVNTIGTAIKKLPVNAAASAITQLAKSITGDNLTQSDVFAGISGVVRNPNVELLFQKMNLRTFSLSFKLAPYTKEDASNIQQIIQFFKAAMLPQYMLGEGDNVFGYKGDLNEGLQAGFIKVPKVCAVSYMKGGYPHPYLPKYKMCAITDVNVNYTPDNNYAVFADGQPVAVELKIDFMETKLVFSEDVLDRRF